MKLMTKRQTPGYGGGKSKDWGEEDYAPTIGSNEEGDF